MTEEMIEIKNEDDYGWYSIHVYSGSEEEVRTTIDNLRNDGEVGEFFGTHRYIGKDGKEKESSVFIPWEVVEINKDGKRREKNTYPGYVFVKLKFVNGNQVDPTVWYRITNSESIVGFVGQSNPVPLQAEEVRRLGIDINQDIDIKEGDSILIINGPFKNMTGLVEKITEKVDSGKKIVRAKVMMFGRETSLDLSYEDVDKL
ncbi:MAG: transcription termination/antitermination protein NusG [Clostridiales Family XIII bacterium]|jgi:transcriptional antiterminator NusG|nr:transcription termination/antitermination protein NusG [Clostridiales Family XIII bacterium]